MSPGMVSPLKDRLYALLRWSERYTKTDMVYLASGSLWFLIGQAGGILISLLSAVVFGHYATQDTYGNYRYAITIAGLLGIFTLSGLPTGVIQSISRGYEGALAQGFRLNLRWSIGIVALSLIAALYYGIVEHNSFLVIALCLIGVSYPLINGFSLYDSLFVAKRQFKRSALFGLINSAVPILAVLVALIFSGRAIVLVGVYLASSLITDALCYGAARREARNSTPDPGLLSYSAHLSIMSIVNAVADKIDSIVVFALLGPANLAIYAYAIAIPEQVKQVVKQVTPLSLARFAGREIGDIRRTIHIRIVFLLTGVTLALVCYVLLAPWLFKILFPVYIPSTGYSQWYALSIVFTAISTPLMAVFQAHKKAKNLYIISNGSSLLLIVLLPTLTYFYGIPGAIASQIVYRASMALFAVWRFTTIPGAPQG
jgi:O-antigen/teichoic acid export membrane protein